MRVAAVTVAGAAAIVGAGVVAVSASGNTAAVDANNVGGVTLKSTSTGAVVTSGQLTDSLTAVGEADSALSGTQAVVYAYVHGAYAYGGPSTSADLSAYQPSVEGTWTGAQLTPAVATSSLTVPLGTSETLGQFLNAYTPETGGLVELRLRTVSPGQAVSDAYDAVDIYVDKTAGTWSTTPSGSTGSPSPTGSTSTSSSPSPSGSTSTSSSPSPTQTTSAPAGGGGGGQQTVTPVASSVTEKIAKKVKKTKKVPITITVSAAGTVPTGTVTVYDGSKKLASKALSGGKASLKLKKLKKGKHKIKTVYSGSATVLASTSKVTKVTSK